ncbi:ABC transporter permease [Paenibacillus sp. GYB003]|uniref:ABC transporter permease n=1 Tax=Paenibacillus sp. GYB003 TaxID=2994392 RepID=UPI002F967FFE
MTAKTESAAPNRPNRTARRSGWKSVRKNWELYLFVLPTMAYFIVFHYVPMYGVQIAFRDYSPSQGIWSSPWVGLDHLQRFFDSYYFWTLIKNTIGISLYELIVGFPVPIVLALALNELRNGAFKKWVQTVTYAPHFISVVVMAGMIIAFTSPGTGLINLAIKAFGGEPIPFLTEPGWFKTVFVLSGVWQSMGWGTIIYLAALAGVDPQQHEAAMIDGATRLQRVWHINLPSIVPTMVILLILNVGSFMSVGFEKVFLLQNPLNLESSDVISTYVYRSGLVQGQFSFSAAIGLFNSVINFILLVAVNRIARRVNETSLW